MKKCELCGGELKKKEDFFKQAGNERFKEFKRKFKETFGHNLEIPIGYNCIKCGQCYDHNFFQEPYKLQWLG